MTTAHYSSNDALEERLIGATAPSGDLATASKAVLKAPGNCTSLLLTPDGGTVVCATQVNYLLHNPQQNIDRYGVAAAGKFTKFPVAKHGQWYSGPAF